MKLMITCMKNEGPFVLEWVAHHMACGFDQFMIYTNDCDDGTDRMAIRLGELGFGAHIVNPKVGTQRPQAVAMRDLFKQPLFEASEWVLFADCDEFLNIHLGDGHLDDLFAAMGDDAEAISIVWRLFGGNKVVDYEDRSMIEQFTRAARHDMHHPPNAWGFKTIWKRSDNVERIGAHRPFYYDREAIQGKWLDSGGRPMGADMIEKGWRFNRNNISYAWAQFNHYAVRSVDSFMVKCDRGHVLHTHKDINTEYYDGMSFNAEEDTSALRRVPATQAKFDQLLADPILAELHEAAVEWHSNKAAELRDRDRPLYQALLHRQTLPFR